MEYLKDFNATKAAIRAGYAEHTARQQGSRLLTKADIIEYMDGLIKTIEMSPEEVKVRLTEMGRASVADFFIEQIFTITDKEGNTYEGTRIALNMEYIKTHGHLVNSIKNTAWGPAIELHDAQTAVVWIGKHHKLFTEKYEIEATLRLEHLDALLEQIYGEPSND